MITRFAPSPTGYLHAGHAYAAGIAHRRARQAGGRFLLRLEDIDRRRCRPEYEAAILDDLAWLGLAWDGEPVRQSERGAIYQAALDRLRAQGVVYRCFCSRAEIAAAAPHGSETTYPGTCRLLSAAASADRAASPHGWRLDVRAALARTGPLAFHDETHGTIACAPAGDPALTGREGWGYHLAATCDDAEQGVTLVSRGEDLLPSTPIHRLLQALLGWPTPVYAHHPLRRDAAGQRLSKRDAAVTLRALRAGGATPSRIMASVDDEVSEAGGGDASARALGHGHARLAWHPGPG